MAPWVDLDEQSAKLRLIRTPYGEAGSSRIWTRAMNFEKPGAGFWALTFDTGTFIAASRKAYDNDTACSGCGLDGVITGILSGFVRGCRKTSVQGRS